MTKGRIPYTEFYESRVVVKLEISRKFCVHKCVKMAKWGEGDPRWIVEDRPDATNVNNWHW